MKVSIIAAISLDGFIAQAEDQNSTDWTSEEDRRFFVKKTKEAGVMIMGRTTFETIGRPLPGRKIIVLTSTPNKFEDIPGQVEYRSDSIADILNHLSNDYEEVIIAGGARVYSDALKAGMVTDLFMSIEPIMFGTGIPFFHGPALKLTLNESKKLNEHTVLNHYVIT